MTFNSTEIFELAFGRAPSAEEVSVLTILRSENQSPVSFFRAVIKFFDKISNPTAFDVQLSEADVVMKEFAGFQLALDRHDIAVSGEIVAERYEPHLTRIFRDLVKPGMCVADVGANVGYYSFLASRLVGPTGHVMAFEPNQENCRLMMLSVEANHVHNIELFPVALSDRPGCSLFVSAIGSNGCLSRDSRFISSSACRVVPTSRLDDIVSRRVDFIKIDVEGAEALVVRGAEKAITQHRPHITTELSMEMLRRVSEVEPIEYLRWFQAIGYTVHLVTRPDGDLELVEDLEGFFSDWGDLGRIEDFVLVP